MEIKIKNNNELIPATLEVVDGVMIVSPVKDEKKVDITQFKDGDVIVCGWDENNLSYSWIAIFNGDIEVITNNMHIGDYCSLDSRGEFLDHNSNSDAATWIRFATEEEKQKLFDALAKENKAWDAEKKEVVPLKWKPNLGEMYFTIGGKVPAKNIFFAERYEWVNDSKDNQLYELGRVFETREECQAYCDRLNQAIMEIKR